MAQDRDQLKSLLDSRHQWPTDFVFKFIVPMAQQEFVKAMFPAESVALRPSSAGRFVSLTVTLKMNSSDEVLEVYARTSGVPGLIAL